MHTILGTGGAIAGELVKILAAKNERVRLVARNPKPLPGATELATADLANLDQTLAAVAGAGTGTGSQIVYLLVGLKYDRNVWRDLWPKIMTNAIESCKRSNAKLIFFDNCYMYGPVAGPMTEQTPFNPCSAKGEIRAAIATQLLSEIKSGNLTALIARSADFYGPNAKTGIPNALFVDNLAKNSKANCLVRDDLPHSYTFTPDAAQALATLAVDANAWNQTWHLPTKKNPPTSRQFIEMAASELGVKPRYRILRKPLIKLAGLFDVTIRELHEMLYQNDREYIFDSTKFEKTYNFEPTSYEAGIKATAAASRA